MTAVQVLGTHMHSPASMTLISMMLGFIVARSALHAAPSLFKVSPVWTGTMQLFAGSSCKRFLPAQIVF